MHLVLGCIPQGSAVLDIGCGTGHFLYLAQRLNKISIADGYDISNEAIIQGQQAIAKMHSSLKPNIWYEDGQAPPSEQTLKKYNVVTLVDVFHHIDKSQQTSFITTLLSNIRSGTRLILTDMDGNAFISNLFAIAHDLFVNKTLVHPRRPKDILDALALGGGAVIFQKSLWSPPFKSFTCCVLKQK